jgi:hypothetical protein
LHKPNYEVPYHKYLPYANFGLFYFISAIFGDDLVKNPKKLHKANIWLMRILATVNFSQEQKSH